MLIGALISVIFLLVRRLAVLEQRVLTMRQALQRPRLRPDESSSSSATARDDATLGADAPAPYDVYCPRPRTRGPPRARAADSADESDSDRSTTDADEEPRDAREGDVSSHASESDEERIVEEEEAVEPERASTRASAAPAAKKKSAGRQQTAEGSA